MGYAQVTFSRRVVETLPGRIEDVVKWADLPADAEVVNVLRDAGISLTTSTWSFPMPSGQIVQFGMPRPASEQAVKAFSEALRGLAACSVFLPKPYKPEDTE